MSMLAGRTPGIDSAAKAADFTANSLDTYIARLEQIVAEVMESWRGGADAAFKTKHEEWRAAGADFVRKLREQAVALQKSSGEYQNTNADATALMNSTQSGGGAAPFAGALGGSAVPR
ncbi:WXG100 family type VII secretion target [Plantactinospora solaniradicis]|uniref:WXG100 family type VII secretion target n=1 Tax=Plantactinospora solaniradicis TaxID=1723736 RepID=A0ABW1KMP7_9ACTN